MTYFRIQKPLSADEDRPSFFGQRLWVDIMTERPLQEVPPPPPPANPFTLVGEEEAEDAMVAAVTEGKGKGGKWAAELKLLAEMGFTDAAALEPLFFIYLEDMNGKKTGEMYSEGMQRILARLLNVFA